MLSCRPLHVCKLGESMYWNFELYCTVLPNTPIYTNQHAYLYTPRTVLRVHIQHEILHWYAHASTIGIPA